MAVSKVTQLKQHKRLATGLFLLMVVVYILMIYGQKTAPAPWIGYVKAFSEAAMVGALADWFAVTALFHHPLGLPIPHTNLIEKSKQSIGDNLGSFVVGNFLTPQNIRPYIKQLSLSALVAGWLEQEKNRELLRVTGTQLIQDILTRLEDDAVIRFIARKGGALVDGLPLPQLIAGALEYFVGRKEHDPLITKLAEKVQEYIGQNQQLVRDRVKEESFFFVPKFVDKKLADKISNGLMGFFAEIAADPNHKIRREIQAQLEKFVVELRTEPKWEEELNKLKSALLTEEQLMHYAGDVWKLLKITLFKELRDEHTALNRYLSRAINELADNLKHDTTLQHRIDVWVRHTAYKYILRHTYNVGELISRTVGNWQGRELSRKLELEVGKDLQFIRINGTLVGGLVGLLIYTLTVLFG